MTSLSLFTGPLRQLTLVVGSEIFAFLLALLLAPPFIRFLHHHKLGKQLRINATTGEKATIFNELHAKKAGTPTMGGVLIWGTVLITALITQIIASSGLIDHSLINRNETWLPLFTLITTALLGLMDDYINIKGQSKGLTAKPKMFWLLVFAGMGAWWFYYKLGINMIHIPLLGEVNIGIWYIPLFIFIISGTANAVNFTDGLDGLAGGLLILAFGGFGIIAFTQSLFILAAFCAVIVGALLAFLWFNVPPAKFYMGDTGALSLGATLGVIAMMTDSAISLILIGSVFVIETLSVIIQLTSKKLFGRKVFLIAPIHHHFEKLGWSEATVVMRFWILGGTATALGVILRLAGKL
jgi:phospho-N-acetylmuramoyl-pentapeptide-transferase